MGRKANRKHERQREAYQAKQRREALARKQSQSAGGYLCPPSALSAFEYDITHQPAPSPPIKREPAPVFSQCVVGYRVWMIDPLGRLRPQSCNLAPWVPGVNVASCERSRYLGGPAYFSSLMRGASVPRSVHAAPAEHCDCGLYARFTASEIPEYEYNINHASVTVVGAVAAWGDLQVHTDGMRAEKMCVTALALTDGMPAEIRALVERVAATYRASAVSRELLQVEAEMHGMPLPDEHRPKHSTGMSLHGSRAFTYGSSAYFGNTSGLVTITNTTAI